MKLLIAILSMSIVAAMGGAVFSQSSTARFETVVLSGAFQSEGADVADFNRDGHSDVVSGPYWYQGPTFERRHAYAVVKDPSIKGYSDYFFSFAGDFNGDGLADIFSIALPGEPAVWFENPGVGDAEGIWTRHLALASVGNESPTFADLTGDGIDELVCIHQGRYGYASPDKEDPSAPWRFIPVTDNLVGNDGGFGRFTHGLGVGDVDGDGRADLLEKDGWWQQSETAGAPFRFHPIQFAESGGSQMFAYDFDGDGDNDVVSVQNAHAYGLCWFERRGEGEDVAFVKHTILGSRPSENPDGLAISQMHALALADLDGDGVKDLVTGKRFWAHGGNDPGASELPVLYWFRTARSQYGVSFEPRRIDARVGVGTQLTTSDVDGNGTIDIVIGNKLGTFVCFNSGESEPIPEPSSMQRHSVGGDEFKNVVRSTDPLSPEAERDTFVVPHGFEVQLVAAEPDIAKPMNMAFDTNGRLWVSSSLEYPIPAAEGEGRDTIKILEDTDQDGRADKITTFADGLNIPIGLYPYGDGVICFSIPNIWYLRDTDGDDRCDKREVLYGPFDYSKDTHGMCNGFTRGFDGWLYCCHGFNNRSTVAGKDGHEVTMLSGNTFRIRLDGSRIEHFTDGQVNPFGMAIDPDGDLFTADCHTKPITLLIRNGVYEGFGKPHDGLGFVPPVMEHLHGSTAIGGIALYHGQPFPTVFHGDAFGGNVMTSRINRNSIHRTGSTVTAREEPDFLISGDPWFRPVDLQVGPDGALYVADFYNRIIGHYEVGLDHPGRDRHRGRIWRIVVSDRDQRRDFAEDPPATQEYELDDPISDSILRLHSPNLTVRRLASDHLVDEVGSQAIAPVRAALATTTERDATVHLLWVLQRLGGLTDTELLAASQNSDARIRRHAFQIVGLRDRDTFPIQATLVAGITDADPMVRRSAAVASAEHRSIELTRQLIRSLHQTAASDAHLKHALRMSLRDHLTHAQHFQIVTASLTNDDLPLIAGLCLGIKTEFAGDFLARHIGSLVDLEPGQLSTYLEFAARYAPSDQLASIAELAQTRFAENDSFQEQLLRSVQGGLLQRGDGVPTVVSHWAEKIARRYLGMNEDDDSLPATDPLIGWAFVSESKTSAGENPWVVSTSRKSADGRKSTMLHSSFPTGEAKTGIYRSDSFELPAQFSFYLAGHDGVPDHPIQETNFVRIRDAVTQAELKRWSPPRNDTAQPITWHTGESAGHRVFVELVDGDDGPAYAWLAAGRFSVTGLNPNEEWGKRRKAAKLIAEFRLEDLRRPVEQLLLNPQTTPEVAAEFATALIAWKPTSRLSAVAESILIAAVDRSLRSELVDVVLTRSPENLSALLGRVMKLASAAQQKRIAAELSSDHDGIETLLSLVQAGQASARLLLDPAIKDKLDSLATEAQHQRYTDLIIDLPSEDETLVAAMDDRKARYLEKTGDLLEGAGLFTKQCSVCHQVAGKGTAVGPNLDGIGNRGLDRIIEDVLTPNRNIDAAFRASIVLTEDGRVFSGLVKRSEGAQLVIVDQTGKEIKIPSDAIETQKTVLTSPMPANFHETLDEKQIRDLLAYLLSLTHQ